MPEIISLPAAQEKGLRCVVCQSPHAWTFHEILKASYKTQKFRSLALVFSRLFMVWERKLES